MMKYGSGLKLTRINIDSSTITIPNVVSGRPVIAISSSVLDADSYRYMRTLIIPKNIRIMNIPEYMFSNFNRLERIEVDSENRIFSSQDGVLFDYNKTNLIHYPQNKRDIVNYTVPDEVRTIGSYAFAGQNYLETIVIGSNARTIESNAFNSCNALKNLIIFNGLREIKNNIIVNCINLTNITIPDSVTTLYSEALSLRIHPSDSQTVRIFCQTGSVAQREVVRIINNSSRTDNFTSRLL